MKTLKLSRGKRNIDCTIRLRLPLVVEGIAGQIAGILGEKTIDVLAAKKQPHVALANMRDDETAATTFVSCWGPLNEDLSDTFSNANELLDLPTTEAVRSLLQSHPGKQRVFQHTHQFVTQHRDTLRKAWKGNRAAIESMERQVSANNNSAWSFNNKKIEISVPDLWTAICILFLRDREAHNAGICERGLDCPAPYFVKPRIDQKFCGTDCKRWARLEVKKKSWHKNKERWQQ